MDQNKNIFITATDTGVGKTMVSGLLLKFLHQQAINAGYQKWASTGDAEKPADLTVCLAMAGIDQDPALLDLQVPYRFAFPASPHLAAELEGKELDPEIIIAAYRQIAKKYEVLVVEGVGGLLVPLKRDLLLADLLGRLQLTTIIVARSGLGTINHTLLTIEAMRSRQIQLGGVIFTDTEEEEELVVEDNMKIIAETGRIEILGRLPHCHKEEELIKAFDPIGINICSLLGRRVPNHLPGRLNQ